jgi:hypothetical protein
MPPAPIQPKPAQYAAGHPGMENHETECYILQSLELLADLATAPGSQYCDPAVGRVSQAWDSSITTDVAPPCKFAQCAILRKLSPHRHQAYTDLCAVATPRYHPWEASSSFQQVYQRTVESQQPLQPKPTLSHSSTAIHSPASTLSPTETQFNHYHAHMAPHYGSVESSTQIKEQDPGLKRIRNTAASARFRAKKKRKEQQLEQEARETQAALNKLENRVTELETENRWLKGLILDKSEASKRKELEIEDGERKGSAHTDGVGTEE